MPTPRRYYSLHNRPLLRNSRHFLLLALIGMVVSACSSSSWVPIASVPTPGLSEPSSGPRSDSVYVWPTEQRTMVGPGATVTITSFDPTINGVYAVDINGMLKLPHDTTLPTGGLDARELEEKIHLLYQGFFKSPQKLRVQVTQKEALIDVQGLVAKPGQYSVAEFTSLDEIIALAGGLKERGDAERVQFLQIKGSSGSGVIALKEYHSGRDLATPRWHGGERLFFQTSASSVTEGATSHTQVVRVLGQVRNPAEYTAKPDSTFFTYLLQAGGPTDRADLASVTLIRGEGAETRARTFNSHEFGDIPPIEPGDTILVNADVATPLEKSTRVATGIAGILTSLSMLALATL